MALPHPPPPSASPPSSPLAPSAASSTSPSPSPPPSPELPFPPLPVHVPFILLAKFDIDSGSCLKHQYPCPTGTPEQVLADLMLPDGAHDRNEDWTVFFLNQSPSLSVKLPSPRHPSLHSSSSLHSSLPDSQSDLPSSPSQLPRSSHPLLYVISLVRTKKNNSLRRGAVCKAMAICSFHPYIQIFKPILLLALEDYFLDPSINCLARLFVAINSMDTSGLPKLSHHERIILRCSERQDIFEEKFNGPPPNDSNEVSSHLPRNSSFPSLLSMPHIFNNSHSQKFTQPTPQTPLIASLSSDLHSSPHHQPQRSSTSSLNSFSPDRSSATNGQPRTHSRASSSLALRSDNLSSHTPPPPSSLHSHHNGMPPSGSNPRRPRDTHFYDTKIEYSGKSIPVRIPLQTFSKEVGDYSLIKLVQTFSSPNALNPNGPFHPHLHSNGASTHPIILLFNALITQKRILFLGHGLSAGSVSEMVLAACGLGSGCGGVLDGFIERAFPYSNLTTYEDFKLVPGYIAGVTNPIFELHTEAWDVFCNIETGKITVSKDIPMPCQSARPISPAPPERTPTEITTASGAIIGGAGKVIPQIDDSTKGGNGSGSGSGGSNGGVKIDAAKDAFDNVFMEDILQGIQAHFGESIIRARFVDYVNRFCKMASRWEEDQLGSSSIGVRTQGFQLLGQRDLNSLTMDEKVGMLGSGAVFSDEWNYKKEIALNAMRIEGWRESECYKLYLKKHSGGRGSNFKFDLSHQISRLRSSRRLWEVEVEVMYEVLVEKTRSNEEVVELLSHLPNYLGGLLPISFGLFHPSPKVRSLAVSLVRRLEADQTGQKFFQSLNAFHKLAYQRLIHQSISLSHPQPSTASNSPAYLSHHLQLPALQPTAATVSTNGATTTCTTNSITPKPTFSSSSDLSLE